MDTTFYMNHFLSFWSPQELHANLIIFLNIVGAMLLGFVVGYERSYHGRAAGMRTYGLVCMASAAVVVIAGYPDFWFGARAAGTVIPDPSRTIQGILTCIGFLGAGVIMKEGFTISGLTTAASVWASSAIGILVGIGFYAAAILLAGLSAACMVWVHKLETWLPSQAAIAVMLRFAKDFQPEERALHALAQQRGYQVAGNTLSVSMQDGKIEWRFVAVAADRHSAMPVSKLADEFRCFNGVESFQLNHAKN